jgi:hypothetical protein
MHPYATDSRERLLVPFLLAAASLVLAYALHLVMTRLNLNPWWLDIPSVFGFYVIFYRVFERWAWRAPIFRLTGIVKVPDLQGEWHGTVSSSHIDEGGLAITREATVQVKQSWTQMCVSLSTDISNSRSQIGGILLSCGPPNPLLTYDYLNEPKPDAPDTLHAHRGTTRLDVLDGGSALEGQYYTGRDRVTHGRLSLRKAGGR